MKPPAENAVGVEPSANPLWLWLYGAGNLWGSIAGLAGVGLFFAGVIGTGWIAIVAGLYAIGAVAAPRPRAPDFSMADGFSAEDVKQQLEQIVSAMKDAADAAVMETLKSIREHVLALLPKIDTPALSGEDGHTLRQIVARYLPETLANYLKLPALYRRYHAVRDGKSAERLLKEQLDVLDEQLKVLMDRVFRAEAQDLLVQGRFLEDKFKRADLLGAADAGGNKS